MTALRLPMGVFISLFLLVITGERLFQERTEGTWPVIDALPQPAPVRLVAKLLALGGLALLLTLVLFLTGVGVQLSAGFRDIDWGLYALDLTIDGFLRFCQLILLGAFIATLTSNRLVSHVGSLAVFLLLWLAYRAGPTSLQPYLYSFLPGSDTYSNLLGYSINGPDRLLTHLLWWGLAYCFGAVAVLFWHRGTPAGLTARWRMGRQRVSRPQGFVLVGLIVGVGVGLWSISPPDGSAPAVHQFAASQRQTQSNVVSSLSGRPISVTITYHDAYQVRHLMRAAQSALQRGEQLFGPYPYRQFRLSEVPVHEPPVRSAPGALWLAETEGWTASHRNPAALDYLDYLISREVFKQWLVCRMQPRPQPGDGFLRQSLAEYLALQTIGRQYGTERLKQRLAQRFTLYTQSRQHATGPETPIVQSRGNDGIGRGRAPLMLASIGQVWSDTALSRTIGQFYRLAIQQPESATATAFTRHLRRQLPDSLRYLTTYLTEPLWFSFSIGRIAPLPNGLAVEIIPRKWRNDPTDHQTTLPFDDRIPLSLLDRRGTRLYTTLVRPDPDQPWVRLPAIAGAAEVIIDPLGTWPEITKRDNRKIF